MAKLSSVKVAASDQQKPFSEKMILKMKVNASQNHVHEYIELAFFTLESNSIAQFLIKTSYSIFSAGSSKDFEIAAFLKRSDWL